MIWYEYERRVLGTVIWYDRNVHVPVSGTKKTRQKRNQFYRFGFVFSKSILFVLLVGF